MLRGRTERTQEWAIKDVARATGLTSRTLRHYEQIGLLKPSRAASNGYRFYGEAEVSRLYRILSLRAVQKGTDMTNDEMFAGHDASQYEGEVRERWGDAAWELLA